jgi:2-methylcitrate dehydratase PrpD
MKSSGREILTALILGYDVAVRPGAGTTQRLLAHQNGQTSLIGAIAAGARLRGLHAAEISRALHIGSTFVLVPSYTNAVAGATALNAAGGMSGFAGALVPEMALAGFLAQDDAIEQALSRLVADGFDPLPVTEDLGTRWEIARSAFRLRACCSPIYASLDALEAGLTEQRPRPDEIQRIDIATYRFASVMNSKEPVNGFASKYSLPHAAAAIILRGILSPAEVGPGDTGAEGWPRDDPCLPEPTWRFREPLQRDRAAPEVPLSRRSDRQ